MPLETETNIPSTIFMVFNKVTENPHKLWNRVKSLDKTNKYNNGGRLITKYQTPAYGIYLTRPIKPDNAIEQVASTLGVGHAVMGIIDPKSGYVRFSQYGANGDNTRAYPVFKQRIRARFKDPANPTEEEMRGFLSEYQRLSGDKNPDYTVRYVPGLNYESVVKSMNENEAGTGEFVTSGDYSALLHNCGHYAAGLANTTLEQEKKPVGIGTGKQLIAYPSAQATKLIEKGVEAIPKYQRMPKGTTTYKLNLNTTD